MQIQFDSLCHERMPYNRCKLSEALIYKAIKNVHVCGVY